ncbi:CDP-diglyceride synthetase [Aurantiacibacter atlanticus]|uniref:Phosphatidate cytidylyltransferase n=1 Tax=Aurantiacibacter atlanticus TaxID=1648404 RepID=A0A0H4VJY3_9SPHN|nr:phosphatidate cytidylyltransferase [Aurantiacibacter atlanticus]AKQ43314.2 CDP-diglyceride synthetase [Aurantiacibacter atlanticus]MDF1834560.1 phosphatidate cytidylyltransferase [Alteraurantiacibacter sp. bin_em_oilr2.035]
MEGGENLSPERRRDRMKAFAKKAVSVPLSVRTGDLRKRAASGIVMLAIAGGALWAGGIVRDAFFVIIGLACLFELARLVMRATTRLYVRLLGIVGGAAYIGYAVYLLMMIDVVPLLVLLFGVVICVDTFAYFFGRTLGGPKIAPRISPSKTWAGLLGGAVGATLAIVLYGQWGLPEEVNGPVAAYSAVVAGIAIAIIAQSGDFFESWLKRKAGMKDSSNLIPGHGGIFDRIDGLIPVVILVGTMLIVKYPHWLVV